MRTMTDFSAALTDRAIVLVTAHHGEALIGYQRAFTS